MPGDGQGGQMMPRPPRRLLIEVEAGDPVSGWAASEGGPRTRFEGMLGFISVFEQLRHAEDIVAVELPDGSGADH
jgi:hypothetical protein